MRKVGNVLLLLVEKSQRGKYCAGQWKDIESLNDLLGSLGAEFECIEFEREHLDSIIGRCSAAGATHIVVYYSFLPELLNRLKRAIPEAKLYVRTVNAEAFQHWQRSEIGFKPNRENLRAIYGAARLVWRDSACKRNADGLLGISEWDNKNYWRNFPGKAVVYDVPYHCPWPLIRSHVKPKVWADRKNQIVCLAGGRDSIGRTMVEGFNDVADFLGNVKEFTDWKFLLSPGIHTAEKEDPVSKHVERVEFLGEPWDLLCSVKAIAVLTPLGFGSKTTIIDALTAGCHVLVHPVLAKRLPEAIKSGCIEFSPSKAEQAESLIKRLQYAPGSELINQILRDQATTEIRRVFDLYK